MLEDEFGVVYPVRVCVLTLLHVLEFVPEKALGVAVAVKEGVAVYEDAGGVAV